MVEVSLSDGVAIGPDDGDTVDALLKAADRQMYEAKRAAKLHIVRAV